MLARKIFHIPDYFIFSECPVRPCPPLDCEFGQKMDNEGCFLCECHMPPTPNPDCEPIDCDLRYVNVNMPPTPNPDCEPIECDLRYVNVNKPPVSNPACEN